MPSNTRKKQVDLSRFPVEEEYDALRAQARRSLYDVNAREKPTLEPEVAEHACTALVEHSRTTRQ